MTNKKDKVEDLKRHGSALMDSNRLEDAKVLFSEIITRHPEDAEVWCLLATVNGRLGWMEDAGECCRRAIALRPDYADAHLNLGTVLFRAGSHEDAIAQYRKVLQIHPQRADVYFNLGLAQSILGRYGDAAESYRAAFRFDPSRNICGVMKQQALILERTNRLHEAKLLFDLLCEVEPHDAEAWHVLSTINGRLGYIDAAGDCCRRVLALQPGHSEAHANLGHVYFQQGRLDEAAAYYRKALDIDPQSVTALNSLARTCITLRHFDEYFEAYRRAVDNMPDPKKVRSVFLSVMENYLPDKYDPWLDDELKKCFSLNDIDYTPIALATALTLKYKYNIKASGIENDDAVDSIIYHIGKDDLFGSFLEKTLNNDVELEMVLTKVRRKLLLRYCRHNDLDDNERRVVKVIACHCFHNEYVFASDEEEERQLVDLKKSLEGRSATIHSPDRELEIGLMVFAMYGGLYTLSCGAHLSKLRHSAWSEDFHPILDESLLHPMEEISSMADIESISEVQDRTSRLVQSQYEENPYPRWLAMPRLENSDISQLLTQEFLHFNPPPFLREPLQILIAGCGTGQQPIQTALYFSKNHEMEITAVDISRRSLAYAMRMARKYNVKNIRFLQGDILELSRIDRRFHIIECQGVLHHMERPVEGWRVLSNLLVDNGLMSIGLYSKAARAGLEPMQEVFKREGLTPDRKNVRDFRYRILKGELGTYTIHSLDFYSTSGCRDLLFHFMEHKYTPLQLDGMMKELNLKFIGFTLRDARISNLYRKHFPQDGDMTDLSLWEEFEKMYPDIFAKMFQFWCQKQ